MSRDTIKDQGVVQYWKGQYGFIRPDASHQQELFFHVSEIRSGEPKAGARCRYFLAKDLRNPDRLRAVDVSIEGPARDSYANLILGR